MDHRLSEATHSNSAIRIRTVIDTSFTQTLANTERKTSVPRE